MSDSKVTVRYRVDGRWFRWPVRVTLAEVDEVQTRVLGAVPYVESFATSGASWSKWTPQSKLLRFPSPTKPAPSHSPTPGPAAA